jgi:hypothetical protein
MISAVDDTRTWQFILEFIEQSGVPDLIKGLSNV